jgi:hypothetical protein
MWSFVAALHTKFLYVLGSSTFPRGFQESQFNALWSTHHSSTKRKAFFGHYQGQDDLQSVGPMIPAVAPSGERVFHRPGLRNRCWLNRRATSRTWLRRDPATARPNFAPDFPCARWPCRAPDKVDPFGANGFKNDSNRALHDLQCQCET